MQGSGLGVVADVFNGEILATGQIRPRTHQDGENRIHRGKVVASAAVTKVNRKGICCTHPTALLCLPHYSRVALMAHPHYKPHGYDTL